MYSKIRKQLDQAEVTLVAVSKTKPLEQIQEMYEKGQRIFGENKAQELVDKYEALPKDIKWHFIGHLQRNKVKYIAPFVSLLHGVDSLRLLKEVNKQAQKNDRTIACLLQFHIAEENTKFGLDWSEAQEMLDSEMFKAMEHIEIQGVMGMATYTDDLTQVRKEFQRLKEIHRQLKQTYFSNQASFKEISMGMSGDYELAIEEGSTMVRIGTLLFGERNYI
ncbi:MAG: YggS family pyridoxal phosphate-dependent enzyme [Saprospiraceae bacterium]